jgi:transcriptional regulator with XRE-family HTH domain
LFKNHRLTIVIMVRIMITAICCIAAFSSLYKLGIRSLKFPQAAPMLTDLQLNLILIRKLAHDERGRELSQAKFAGLQGMDQSTISRFEQGLGLRAMEKRLQTVYDHLVKDPAKLKAYGLELSWFAPDTLRLPHDRFQSVIGHSADTPAEKPAAVQSEESPAFSAEELPSLQRLVGSYRLLRRHPPSPAPAATEVVEIFSKRNQAEMRLRRLPQQGGQDHELNGKLTICGAGFTVPLHNAIPNGPILSLNCIPDSGATVELMLATATESVGGFSVFLSGAPAFLKRIHLSAGEKMEDALRKVEEEVAKDPASSKNEYDRLLEQYGRHFAFWGP